MKRPRNHKKGETLAETLCAVLVTGLATALLMGLVSAASRLERKTLQAAGALYKTVSAAEGKTGTGADGNVTVKIEGGAPVSLPVTFYGSKDQAVAYQYPRGGG